MYILESDLPPEVQAARKEGAAVRHRYHEAHYRCPLCGSDSLIQTLIGIVHTLGEPYVDRVNRATCQQCPWKGVVDDLVPKR